jgi:putative peptidoglycan lipid II flippase
MSLRESIRSLWVVSGSTAGSRVLGLLRDILTTASLGIGAISSAFLYAFTLPNLFRRLLGEGALTSTLIPTLSKARTQGGDAAVFRLMNGVLSWLILVLIAITLLGSLIFYCLPTWFPEVERVQLLAEYGIILFPYLILVCLAAAFAAFLQVFQRFALAALSPVWLNLAMILCLVLVLWLVPDMETRAWWLCWSVLLGGVIQVLLPMRQSWQIGWRPEWILWGGSELREVWRLFLPGVLGASVFQVNILVSRTLALKVDAAGVSYLYLANRLMELPLGLITIAVTTVAFPLMSRSFSEGRHEGAVGQYSESVRLVLSLMIPAAIGLVLLAEPILRILFLYGGVTAVEISQAAPVLQVFALGLPFYSLATLATRVFHARCDTRTPVKIAIVAFLINLTGSLLLMNVLGVLGLAWANLISVVIQSLLLEILWRRQMGPVNGMHWEWSLGKPILSAILMGVAVYLVSLLWDQWETVGAQVRFWGKVLVGIPVGGMVYLGALLLLRAPEGQVVISLCQRYIPFHRGRALAIRTLNIIKNNRLLTGMLVLLALAFVFPEPGSKNGVLHPQTTTQIGLVVIFLIQGLCIHWKDWLRGLLDWKLHLFTQIFIFLIFPLVILLLLWGLRGAMNESLWMGLAYMTLLPTTVATAVVYTSKSMGDSAAALFNCLLSNILGVFIVPLGVALVLELDSDGFPYMETLLHLFMLVVLPTLIGQIFSRLLWGWVSKHRAALRSITEAMVLFTAYCAFSESVIQRSWAGLDLYDIGLGIGGILVILILIRVIMWHWLRLLRFSVVQRKAAFFCGVQKTIALGIPMGYFIFSGYSGVGLILFPLIIYHFCQLILDGAIANRWANQETT